MRASRTPRAQSPDTLQRQSTSALLSEIPRTMKRAHHLHGTPANARQVCLQAAYELLDACESSLRKALQKRSTNGRLTCEEVKMINNTLNSGDSQHTRPWPNFDDVANARLTAAGRLMKRKKPAFNHEYTPLLEKYFEYNAYPSALDRAVLAWKSMMTPRQIEVWFQNHRNRARKEGKPLRKLTEDPLPHEISLTPLERKMPFFIIPEHDRMYATRGELLKDESSDEEDTPSIPTSCLPPIATDVFNPSRPPHAFPTPYPPCCDYKSFPTSAGSHRFPQPVWFRKPAAPCRTPKPPLDFDGFLADFETKLHLRAPLSHKRPSKATQSWSAFRVTIPASAPHPALVRTPVISTARYTSRLPAIQAPSSLFHPFRSPSPFSQPTTLVPPQHSDETSPRRKIDYYPKCTPKNTSISHHRGDPTFSQAFPAASRSSSSTSRSSSSSSDIASEQRPSSSPSNSSLSSSTPATPDIPCAEFQEVGCSSLVSCDFKDSDGMFATRGETLPRTEETSFAFAIAIMQQK